MVQAAKPIETRPTAAPTPTETLSSGEFELQSIDVRYNTAISNQELAALFVPFLNRRINSDSLRDLQLTINNRYRELGYINSRVVVPDQDVSTGTLVLEAQEGGLEALRFIGDEPPPKSRARLRLNELAQPLNLVELQETLRLIEQDSQVRSINARLLPGSTAQTAVLELAVEQESANKFDMFFNNHRSPSIGGEAIGARFSRFNPTGAGDRFIFGLTRADGQFDGSVFYSRPVFRGDTALSLSYRRGASEVVESSFRALDIENDIDSAEIRLSHRFVDRLTRRVAAGVSLARTSSQTELLDEPFSFSLGADAGESTTVVLQAELEWSERLLSGIYALRLGVRQGIDAFDATISEGTGVDRATGSRLPDGKFTAWVLQAQYARSVSLWDSQIVFNGAWQASNDPLLSVQKVALGGVGSLRGYRENALVRDRGYDLSLEWRVPLFAEKLAPSGHRLAVTPFVDHGSARDNGRGPRTVQRTRLSSAGLGVTYFPRSWVGLNVVWGYAFDDHKLPEPASYDLQDDGLHFELTLSYPPR